MKYDNNLNKKLDWQKNIKTSVKFLAEAACMYVYKYDKQLEQVCNSIQCISMLCIMPKVSLCEYYKTSQGDY